MTTEALFSEAAIARGLGCRTIVRTGWIEGMSMADYLAIPALSASGLWLFSQRSPAHYKAAQDEPREETDEQRTGTALHTALLEPELFDSSYIVLGQCVANTDNGKGKRCTNPGKVRRGEPFDSDYCGVHDPAKGQPMPEGTRIVKVDEIDSIRGMRDAVLKHETARKFFVGKGRSEVVGVWRDKATGVLCKIRLDRQLERAAFIHADVKTCQDASTAAFPRQAARMGYVHRSAWYRRGMEALGTPATASVLVAVERDRPHGVNVFALEEKDLGIIGGTIDAKIREYAECLERDEWPAYPAGIRHLSLPAWALPEQEFSNQNEWAAAAAESTI